MYEPKRIPSLDAKTAPIPEIRYGILKADHFIDIEDPTIDPLHIHGYLEIFFSISAEVSFLINDTIYPVTAGDLVSAARMTCTFVSFRARMRMNTIACGSMLIFPCLSSIFCVMKAFRPCCLAAPHVRQISRLGLAHWMPCKGEKRIRSRSFLSFSACFRHCARREAKAGERFRSRKHFPKSSVISIKALPRSKVFRRWQRGSLSALPR